MADTGKSVRVARTNLGGGLGQAGAPTERSQLVGQTVHQFKDTESDALYMLNDAIGRFVGAGISGLNSVSEGYQRGKLEQIRQQNEAQKKQALGDALKGDTMDPDLENDADYYDAFRSVRAQRDGFSASQDFTNWYMSEWLPANPTGDLMGARDQWALENLTGSDDADYEGQVLASFFDRTDALLPEHSKAVLKFQIDKGIATLGELIDADVQSGLVTPQKLATYMDQARTLDPLNATEAPTRVVDALVTAADNHPNQMMVVSKLLAQPGTGVNGKSFAQSFPEAYADFQRRATSAYEQINSSRELEAYTALTDRLLAAQTPDDLVAITVDAVKFRDQFGAPGRVDALLGEVNSALTKMGAEADLAATTMAHMNGDFVDPEDVKKGWPLVLKQAGLGSVLDAEDPAQGAALLASLRGLVPSDTQAHLSAAILDPRDPAMQEKAVQMLSILSKTVGKDVATSYLNTAAKHLFDNAYAHMAVAPNAPLAEVMARVNEGRANVKDWDAGWNSITGIASETEATNKAREVIQNQVNEALGKSGFLGIGKSSVTIPPWFMDDMLTVARQSAINAVGGARGWEDGVKDAVAHAVSTAEVMRGPKGDVMVPKGFFGDSAINENGEVVPRPRLGYNVLNNIGRPVHTVEVFETQAKELADTNLFLFPSGDRNDIALAAPPMTSELRNRGMYAVTDKLGQVITFDPGEEVILGSQQDPGWTLVPSNAPGAAPTAQYQTFDPDKAEKVKLPATAEEMNELFDFGPGFALVQVPIGDTFVWQLGYLPNFGGQAGKTLAEQEAGYKAPARVPFAGGFGGAFVQFDPTTILPQ